MADVNVVTMEDGRKIEFGKRKMLKDIVIEDGKVGTRFDFSNGATRMYWVPELHKDQAAGHGLGQKLGDFVAGAKDDQGNPIEVDDMVLEIDGLYERLASGPWNQVGEGTGTGGGSIILKAMMEGLGKSIGEVKDIIDKTIAGYEAKGQKPSRRDLYASLRETTKLKPIIERMEKEAAAKRKHLVDGDALLASAFG